MFERVQGYEDPLETLRPAEAAVRFGVSRATIYRAIKEGRVPVVRFGPRSTRLSVVALRRWLEEGGQVN